MHYRKTAGRAALAREQLMASAQYLSCFKRLVQALLSAVLLCAVFSGRASADEAVEVQTEGGQTGLQVQAQAQEVSTETITLTPLQPSQLAQEPQSQISWLASPLDVESLTMPTDPAELIKHLAADYSQPHSELSLEQAVQLALTYNHDLNRQRLNAAAACVGIEVNWADLRPQLSLQAKAYKQETNVSSEPISIPLPDGSTFTLDLGGGDEDDIIRQLAFALTQRIYDFGLTNELVDVAEAQHAIQSYTVRIAEQQLVDSLTAAYLGYTLAWGQLRIRNDELALAEEFLRQTKIQFEVGTVPRLDVIRAEQRVQQSLDGVIKSQALLGDASAAFFALLGVEDQRYVPALTSAEMLELGAEPPAVDSVINTALEQRPEIELAYSTLFAGQAQKKLTANRPILQAYANAMYQEPASSFQGTDSYEYGISLMWNVYTGGKDKLKRKQAELQLAALSEGILDLEAKIELDATTAWNRLHAARSSTEAAGKTLELSAEGLRAAAVGYSAGVTPYLDFADALDKNVAAAIAYLISLINVQLAESNLFRAQGFPNGYPGQVAMETETGGIASAAGIDDPALLAP